MERSDVPIGRYSLAVTWRRSDNRPRGMTGTKSSHRVYDQLFTSSPITEGRGSSCRARECNFRGEGQKRFSRWPLVWLNISTATGEMELLVAPLPSFSSSADWQ